MRHQHMVGKAAIAVHAEGARRQAQLFAAVLAGPASGAADPRVHDAPVAHCDANDIRANGRDRAGDLVAEHTRQGDAAAQVEFVAVAEIEVAVMQMKVAVTHAAAADPHDDFIADGLRRLAQHQGQGLTECIEGVADHASPAVMGSAAV